MQIHRETHIHKVTKYASAVRMCNGRLNTCKKLILGAIELKGTRIPGACPELRPVYVIPVEGRT